MFLPLYDFVISLFSKFGYDCRSCVYCKVLFHYTVPVWKSTVLVIGIWNIIYWGPHLSPQPTCMLFFRYYLWVLVHLNYRDIKWGEGSQVPQNHPLATPLMRRKKFCHPLFTSSIKCEIWHYLVLVVQWWLEKCSKKRAELLLCLFVWTYCLFDVLFVVAVVPS